MSGPTSYQRVTTPTDYDASVGSYYLKYDGIDDYMNLPYMGLYASGAASVVIGLRMSNASGQRVVHEANSANSLPWYGPFRNSGGSCGVAAVDDAGTVFLSNTATFGDTSVSKIISTTDDGLTAVTYINSALSDSDAYVRTSKTVTLNTTSIGASVSTTVSGYSAMNHYGSIIVKGAALTDKQRKLCEQYLARKAGATLQ